MSQFSWPPITTTSAPIQYNLNSVATTVSQDTVTPANSKPLPVINLNTSGAAVDPSTSTLQAAEAVLIGPVTETAPASDTASSGLNGRLQRIAQRLTSLISLLPTTLGSQAAATSLAVAQSTEDIARVGIITETAPASDTASSGLNGRLQRIAQRITSLIALFPSALGQGTMSQGFKVVFGSDQTPFADLVASGTITTQNLTPGGAATAGSAVLSGTINGQNNITIQITGVYTGALSLQGTVDNSNWKTIGGIVFTDVSSGIQTSTIASATQSIFQADCAGFQQVRITGLAAMTGTATVTMRLSSAAGLVGLDTAMPAGTNIIGKVGIDQTTPGTTNLVALANNQSVNTSQVNGVTVSTGVGPTGTGVQRVKEANISTATLANVASSATTVTLQASNSSRSGLACFNDSTQTLYLKLGATASTTSYTVQILAGGYYELPQPVYSGIVDGIWASANGNARMTEW